MNVFIRFLNETDVTVHDVSATDRKDGIFYCLDLDGDKMFAAAEYNILYITWEYDG